MPRYVGNPLQNYVATAKQFAEFIQLNAGDRPCFTSHNAYPDSNVVKHRYLPFDFDNEEKPENALHDALKFRDWCEDHDLSWRIAFSGKKGFHGYISFRPSLIRVNPALKDRYSGFQNKVISEASLRTADQRIVGDDRRMMRIVNTPHQDTGLYCVEVPEDILEEGDINLIKDYAKAGRPPPKDPEPEESFSDAIRRLEVKDYRPSMQDATDFDTVEYHGDTTPEFVKEVLPRPCIHNDLMTQNPKHKVRFEACSQLTNVGYDLGFILKFFDDVAEKAKWVDRHNRGERYYQVKHIHSKGEGYYQNHSCETLRKEGLCVGPQCSIFEDIWPEEVDDDDG